MIGETHGHYHITERIGAGGMGEVYRATDTKLKREVAIKVLPDYLAQDPARLARFQREAELLASLNHPHIAAIHGLEEAAGKPLLILELVEGEDLKERLERGAIPTDEALEIARQSAEALEEAHARGIVHRDLKPANVKVTPDGKVRSPSGPPPAAPCSTATATCGWRFPCRRSRPSVRAARGKR